METNILGNRIKTLRLETNLTQEEFGKPYSLKKSTVSQYESGSSRPDDELKKRIALDYNVSLDWLMGLVNVRTYGVDVDDLALELNSSLDKLPKESYERILNQMMGRCNRFEPELSTSQKVALKLADQLTKDGYELEDNDLNDLILVCKVALEQKKNKK